MCSFEKNTQVGEIIRGTPLSSLFFLEESNNIVLLIVTLVVNAHLTSCVSCPDTQLKTSRCSHFFELLGLLMIYWITL